LGVDDEPKKTRTKYLAIHYSYGLAIINCEYCIMEVKDFRITFESKSAITKNAITAFTVRAKNYCDAEKKALAQFDKREKRNCIIVIEKMKKVKK
jgi:hypothetical protein